MDAFETFLCSSDRISPSLPSSFDGAPRPFGPPQPFASCFRCRQTFFGALRNQIAFDLGKEPKERNHGFGLEIVFSLETDGLFNGHEAHVLLDQAINDLQNLTEAAAKARQLTHDYPIT